MREEDMLEKRVFKSKIFIVSVLAAFSLLVFPVAELNASQVVNGSLIGFIYDKDMKTPVANAVVKLKNVNDQREYASSPADQNGMYKVTGLPQGRYILGVAAPAGDFNFNYLLNIKTDEMAKLSVALVPGVQETAQTEEETKKKSFFTSPAGIMLLVTVAGVVLYAVFNEEKEASPIR